MQKIPEQHPGKGNGNPNQRCCIFKKDCERNRILAVDHNFPRALVWICLKSEFAAGDDPGVRLKQSRNAEHEKVPHYMSRQFRPQQPHNPLVSGQNPAHTKNKNRDQQ